jgi:hypothetical protein
LALTLDGQGDAFAGLNIIETYHNRIFAKWQIGGKGKQIFVVKDLASIPIGGWLVAPQCRPIGLG